MAEYVESVCENCRERVWDGPEGGYTCSNCGHSQDPPAMVVARVREGWERRAAQRTSKTPWVELRRLARDLNNRPPKAT